MCREGTSFGRSTVRTGCMPRRISMRPRWCPCCQADSSRLRRPRAMFSSPPCLEVRTMSSRVRTLVKATFAVFVVLGTVMATSVPARADMGTPAWHIGDWWHYRLINASSPAGGTGPGTLEIIVIGTTDVTVAGVIYPTYDTKDWVNVTPIGASATSNTTLRSIDYEYTVQTTTEVAVPKGTFSVTPVQQTEIGVPGDTVAYWSGDVGNYAKQAAYDSNGDERSSGELM